MFDHLRLSSELSRCRAYLCISTLAFLFIVLPGTSRAQEVSLVGKVLDHELSMLERDFVSLAEAMPADKFDYVPKEGEFAGVRNFSEQISHTARVIYTTSAAMLGEKLTPELGSGELGPATLKTKDDFVGYLKGSIALAHKAMAKLTEENLKDQVQAVWGPAPRLFMANLVIWHSYDHYGQLVVYLRMNGIVPPASRPRK